MRLPYTCPICGAREPIKLSSCRVCKALGAISWSARI